MKIRNTLITLAAMAALTTACDEKGPRDPGTGFARLGDDLCMEVEECRLLSNACGGNQECVEALNAVVVTPDGKETTIAEQVVSHYQTPQ
ncbi:MAG: hypothetical protein AAF721_00820 [Myxococcota bacterium]